MVPQELAVLLNSEHATVIDVREEGTTTLPQIPGARVVPYNTFESHAADLSAELEGTDELLVFVCEDGGHRSRQCARVLLRCMRSYSARSRVRVLQGGFHAWHAAFANCVDARRYLQPAPGVTAAPEMYEALKAPPESSVPRTLLSCQQEQDGLPEAGGNSTSVVQCSDVAQATRRPRGCVDWNCRMPRGTAVQVHGKSAMETLRTEAQEATTDMVGAQSTKNDLFWTKIMDRESPAAGLRRAQATTGTLISTRCMTQESMLELHGMQTEETLAEVACEQTMDTLPMQTLDFLPWHLDSHTSSSSASQANEKVAVGMPVTVRSESADTFIKGVVVDSDTGWIKVQYCVKQRCCTKILQVVGVEHPSGTTAGLTLGAPVLVRSSSTNTWFLGRVVTIEGERVKVHFKHNGRHSSKNLRWNSPDLRMVSGAESTTFEQLPSLGTKPLQPAIRVGSAVRIRSTSAGRYVEGIVTDKDYERIKVVFSLSGRGCCKILPLSQLVFAKIDQDSSDTQTLQFKCAESEIDFFSSEL